MNIILGENYAQFLTDRYVVLRLDSFSIPGQKDPVPSYCVIDSVPLDELSHLQQWIQLHAKLIENYNLQNWDYCQQAIEHLMGRWQGDLDSFYNDLLVRVQNNRTQGVASNWTPVIARS